MDFLNRREGLSADALWKFTDLSTSVQKHLEQVRTCQLLWGCTAVPSLKSCLFCAGVPDIGSAGAGGGKRCGRAEHPAHPTLSLHGEARRLLKPLMLLEASAPGSCCALQIGFAACSYFLASTPPNPKKMTKRCAPLQPVLLQPVLQLLNRSGLRDGVNSVQSKLSPSRLALQACFYSCTISWCTPCHVACQNLLCMCCCRYALAAGTALFQGAAAAPLVQMALALHPGVLVTAFLGTAAVFACFSAAALVSRRRSYLYLTGGCLLPAR